MEQVRRIKVGYGTRRGQLPMEVRDGRGDLTEVRVRPVYRTFPSLRLSGDWMADAGFGVGDRVSVAVSDGCLVVTQEGGEGDDASQCGH